MGIANRIKGLEHIKGSQLRPHPKNPRKHPDGQIKALEGALAQIGIADALVVYRAGDGVMTLIDGHCRGEHWVDVDWPCLVLDVTDEEADFILATLDPLSGLASIDDEKMQRLLESVDFECEELLEALVSPQLGEQDGDDLEDGFSDSSTANQNLADTSFTFGQYRFDVEREAYLDWQEKLRQKVGFDNPAAEAEIRKRLKL
jgi:hypothetical protein